MSNIESESTIRDLEKKLQFLQEEYKHVVEECAAVYKQVESHMKIMS